jgi:hypothetical protein
MSFVEPTLVPRCSSGCAALSCIGLGVTTYEDWLDELR